MIVKIKFGKSFSFFNLGYDLIICKLRNVYFLLFVCFYFSDQCDLLSIWDDLQPAFRNQAQFCSEMIIDKTPASWNVYINDHYAIVMMFSQSVQIHLKEYKLAEHIM